MNEGQSSVLTTTLVPCSICNDKTAIYRCPGCFTRTCSLSCCLLHKEKSGCDGKRNRVGFVPLHRYNDSTLSSDYHFLEEILTKSGQGKRLIKEVGADTRVFSHGSKRRRIDESRNDNSESCDGEGNLSSTIPIQPLLRLKVEDEKQGPTGGQKEDQNDLSIEMSFENAPSSFMKKNPMLQEKVGRANDAPTLALSTEKEDYLKHYPAHKKRLVKEAQHRGIELLLMAQGMQRHIMNKKSTKYDKKKDLIHWKVEFIIHDFTQREESLINNNGNIEATKSNKVILTSDSTPESEPISKFLSNLLERNSSHSAASSTRSTLLRFCNSSNRKIIKDNVCALMKRIPCKSSQPSYRKVNLNSSLREVLKGTTVIENPIIEVVLEDDLCRFPVFIQEV